MLSCVRANIKMDRARTELIRKITITPSQHNILRLIENLSSYMEKYFISVTSSEHVEKPFKNRIVLFTTNERSVANNVARGLFTICKTDALSVTLYNKYTFDGELVVSFTGNTDDVFTNRRSGSSSCFYVCLFYGKHDETSTRSCPLPNFAWADHKAVWAKMVNCEKMESPRRAVNVFDKQKHIKQYTKAILFDWLLQACAEFKMHRETYYLTIDYIDRYLTTNRDIVNDQLQLLGITCLFIAAKVCIFTQKLGC